MAGTKRKARGAAMSASKKRRTVPRQTSDDQEPTSTSIANTIERSMTDSTSTNSDDEPFCLMDLPGELRNHVYEKALEIHPVARLSRSGKKQTLMTECPLLLLSKQVHSEVRNVLELNVPIIETLVRDFHFGHIITFLNRLPGPDLKKITADTIASKRVLRCKLFAECGDVGHMTANANKQLERWLKRMDRSDKRGTHIEFEYVLYEGTEGQKLIDGSSLGAKGQAEFDKIMAAGSGHFF